MKAVAILKSVFLYAHLPISQLPTMRKLLLGVTGVAMLLVMTGFFGHVHRAADSISIARPIFGFICIFGVLTVKAGWLRLVVGTTGLAAISSVAVHFFGQEPGGDLRVYSKNLWFANTSIQAIAADIEVSDVDVVMLQEVSDRNDAVLELLAGKFPYQHLCRFSGWSGIALLSKHQFDGNAKCSERRAVLAAPIKIEEKRVWVVSTHLPWPWPHDSARNDDAAHKVLSELDGHIVIAGDYNIVPWSKRVARIAELTDTKLAGSIQATYHLKQLPLPIDLVLAPGGGSLEKRPLLGSDHAGLVADLRVWSP